MKSIDPKNISQLIEEIHDDYSDTINEFSKGHAQNILEFCELISTCHKKLSLLNTFDLTDERSIHVGRFIYMAIDNVYLSVKFLSLGYFAQSGNSMRQSLESVCMAILISQKGEIKIGKNKTINFFKSYLANEKSTRAHNSLKYLNLNIDTLGIRKEAVDAFFVGKDHYNDYSHPNMLTFESRMVDLQGGSFLIGGGYDSDKYVAYKKEIEDRVKFVKTLPDFIVTLMDRLKCA